MNNNLHCCFLFSTQINLNTLYKLGSMKVNRPDKAGAIVNNEQFYRHETGPTGKGHDLSILRNNVQNFQLITEGNGLVFYAGIKVESIPFPKFILPISYL